MQQPNEYTLTQDEQAMISPLIEAVENYQRDAQAILRAITRMRGLEGQWNLNGNKLIKVQESRPHLPVMDIQETLEPVGATANGNG